MVDNRGAPQDDVLSMNQFETRWTTESQVGEARLRTPTLEAQLKPKPRYGPLYDDSDENKRFKASFSVPAYLPNSSYSMRPSTSSGVLPQVDDATALPVGDILRLARQPAQEYESMSEHTR